MNSYLGTRLTYYWISQLSTHNPGISAGEGVVTDCAPLVAVADLHSSFIFSDASHQTKRTISTVAVRHRNCWESVKETLEQACLLRNSSFFQT